MHKALELLVFGDLQMAQQLLDEHFILDGLSCSRDGGGVEDESEGDLCEI
jgi:hypothetical protein